MDYHEKKKKVKSAWIKSHPNAKDIDAEFEKYWEALIVILDLRLDSQ